MKELFSCAEHIEEIIDDAVFDGFKLPILDLISDVDKSVKKCEYCKNPAIYMISSQELDTK